MKKPIKITVTGAAGQIGYSLLFRLAAGEAFGKDTPIELQLLELEGALGALNGVGMELDDCAFPLLKKITCTSDLKVAFKDTDWALLVGSVPRKQGMERADLLKINGSIFTAQGQAIDQVASDQVKTFVIGNPCNTNALIAMNAAPRVAKTNFFAMTSLDENRAKAQLAKKANVEIDEVSSLAIWGNHSATQYPDFYHAKIQGKPAIEVIKDIQWLQNDFITRVQQRGAEIIKARGLSSAASAANAVITGLRALTQPTGDHFYSMAKCSHGEYGIEDGLIFSFPCKTINEKCHTVLNLEHASFSLQKIKETHEELKAERDAVRTLKLIP